MSEERPWLHNDAVPPQSWLQLVATELLETKVAAEWLAAEWDSAVQDCSVPLVKTTGELRARLSRYPSAFQSTMLRLGGRIAAALESKVTFEWDDFKQSLCERAEFELGRRCSSPATEEAADAEAAAGAEQEEADVKPDVKADVGTDAVFERHASAQTAMLVQQGKMKSEVRCVWCQS